MILSRSIHVAANGNISGSLRFRAGKLGQEDDGGRVERAPLLARRHSHSSKDLWALKSHPQSSCGFARVRLVYSECGISHELMLNASSTVRQRPRCLTSQLHASLRGNLLHTLGFWTQLQRQRLSWQGLTHQWFISVARRGQEAVGLLRAQTSSLLPCLFSGFVVRLNASEKHPPSHLSQGQDWGLSSHLSSYFQPFAFHQAEFMAANT